MKEKADEALTELGGLKGSLEELEQKLDRSGGDGGAEVKSIGSQFTESDDFCASRTTRAKVTAPSLRSRLI